MNRSTHFAAIALLICTACESPPMRVAAEAPTDPRVETEKAVPAAPSPSHAPATSIRDRDTHPACSATGQQQRDEAPPEGSVFVDAKQTRTATGYVVQTAPQVMLDIEKPFASFRAEVGTKEVDALEFGRFVEVDYQTQFVSGAGLGAKNVITAVRPAKAARFAAVAFEYQPAGARKLTIYHDGSARYELEPIEIAADDVAKIMAALGAAGVDQMAESGHSMTLTCARRQQLPINDAALAPVHELIAEILPRALGALEQRLQYAWSFPSPVPWTLPRTSLATRVQGRTQGRPSYDPSLPAKLSEQIAIKNRAHPGQASVFEQDGKLYRVERPGAQAATFAQLTVHECTPAGPFCYLLPEDLDLEGAPPDGAVLRQEHIAVMAVEAQTRETPLHGWAVGGGNVYGGLTLVRQGPTADWQVRFSGARHPLLKWPKGAPPLENYYRDRRDAQKDDQRKHPLFQKYGSAITKHLAASKPRRGMPGKLAPAFVLDRGAVYQIFDNCPAENLPCAKGTYYALGAKPIDTVVWPGWAVDLQDSNVPLPTAHYAEHRRFYDTIRRKPNGVGAVRGMELFRFVTLSER